MTPMIGYTLLKTLYKQLPSFEPWWAFQELVSCIHFVCNGFAYALKLWKWKRNEWAFNKITIFMIEILMT